MTSFKGRDFILKIGNGNTTEVFTTIGAARSVAMALNNNPLESTTMDSQGVQSFLADAGVQTMQMTLDGFFKDSASEELLRAAAMGRLTRNYQLIFGNGDMYQAAFVIQDYNRGGSHDGLETFSVTLLRSGAGVFTAAA